MLALRLLLFTGARLREILHLEWRHVDLDRGLILLPDSKTGRKTIVMSTLVSRSPSGGQAHPARSSFPVPAVTSRAQA